MAWISTIGPLHHGAPFTTQPGLPPGRRTPRIITGTTSSLPQQRRHEGGHALYDTVSETTSPIRCWMARIQEHPREPSRFYEDINGRSRGFCRLISPSAELFPGDDGWQNTEELYRASTGQSPPSSASTPTRSPTAAYHVRNEREKRSWPENCRKDLPESGTGSIRIFGATTCRRKNAFSRKPLVPAVSSAIIPTYALGSAYGARFWQRMIERWTWTLLERAIFANQRLKREHIGGTAASIPRRSCWTVAVGGIRSDFTSAIWRTMPRHLRLNGSTRATTRAAEKHCGNTQYAV